MRDNRVGCWVLVLATALLLQGVAGAAGLGRLTLLSVLGQSLNAEIELTAVQPGTTITARLAALETYQRHNVTFSAALTGTRVAVEKRPGGQIFLRATTPRPVAEPFLELLIEINSEHGRVTRQYTLLLDPPGYGSAVGEIAPPAAAAPAASPAVTAAPVQAPAAAVTGAPLKPEAPPPKKAAAPAKPAPPAKRAPRAKPEPAAAPTPAAAPVKTPAAAGAKQYGPIKSGETLNSIARSVAPEGVSLEQALVGIFRHNPDAFIRKNMNLVKSGKILQIPEAAELAAVPVEAARQEIRVHVADFNSYRNKLADSAGAAPEGGSVASGRIAPRVADAAAGEGPRDTVRLSPGDAATKGKGKGGAAERLRALEEESIAREKALAVANERIAQLEKTIKDMQRLAELKGATPEKVAQAPAAVAVPATKPPAAEPAKGPAPAPEPAKGPAPDAATAAAAAPAQDAAAPAKSAPKVEVAAKAPPPAPAPAPGIVDMLLDEPLYLAAGGAVVLLGGLGFVAARRRRTATKNLLPEGDDRAKIAPTLGGRTAAAAALATASAVRADEPEPLAPELASSSAAADNDLNFQPGVPDAAQPAADPEPLVQPMPAEAEAGERAVPVFARTQAFERFESAPEPAAAVEPLAFDTAQDALAPRRESEPAADTMSAAEMLRAAQEQAAAPLTFEIPAAPAAAPAAPAAPDVQEDKHTLDFKIEPPTAAAPAPERKTAAPEEQPPMDFKLDLDSLDFAADKPASATPAHDDHWYDVQQKFDLAKAYEEMGDKDGARAILSEVLKEGDTQQKAQATKLLGTLS